MSARAESQTGPSDPGSGLRLGGHVRATDPLGTADALGLDLVQLHLSSPRMWRPPRRRPDADVLRASGRVATVHAAYLCNPASGDPQVRTRSLELLQATLDAASEVGAGGVIVHAGHAAASERVEDAVHRWTEAVRTLASDVPLWIENTASGQVAVGRRLDDLVGLVTHLRQVEPRVPVGVCLDTAHAFAGDPAAAADPGGWVRALAEGVGRIDVLHVNDSGVGPGAGRDRHTNLGAGCMGLDALGAMVAAVRDTSPGAAALLETPGDDDRRRQDLEILRYLATRA